MTLTADDLGVLGHLAVALGVMDDSGNPAPGWLEDPLGSLKTVLADDAQREALIAFVDEAMGGADRETDLAGATWLPLVDLDDPALTFAVTLDDAAEDHVDVGLGLKRTTASPQSTSSVSVPLFRCAKRDHIVASPFLLGAPGGRLRASTLITVDAGPPLPGEARLGSIGLEVDAPTAPDDAPAVFGLVLEDFQLAGAAAPQTLRLAADSADELDDAILELVLSLVGEQAATAGGSPLGALAGLLGLAGDAVPSFPAERLADEGVGAVGAWLAEVVATAPVRQAWLGHLAALTGGTRSGDEVAVTLGAIGARVRVGVRTEPGTAGATTLVASAAVDVGSTSPRVEVRTDLVRIDLATGAATALPLLGVWAAVGRLDGVGTRVLDVTEPAVARADALRLGFALDADRRLAFVLAADVVRLGTRDYAVLDLSTPDAVMDAAGTAVEDVAAELLGNLGDAEEAVAVLLGLAPPPEQAAPVITPADLLGDPLGAVAGYWHTLLRDHPAAVPAALGVLRDAVADAGATAAPRGTGTDADPWWIPLLGPLALEARLAGDTLALAVAITTQVDTLGQGCTTVITRMAATVATVDLAARTAQLLGAVEGRLTAHERGTDPPRVTLGLGGEASLVADAVGLRLAWAPDSGLTAGFEAPALALHLGPDVLPIPVPVIAADGSVTLAAEEWDAVQALLSTLGLMVGGIVADAVTILGWGGQDAEDLPGLRVADLLAEPAATVAAWLRAIVMSALGPAALALLADLLTAAGPVSGALAGSGHPDDPYRLTLDLAPGTPELVAWLPPAGRAPLLVGAPEWLQRWRPGDPAIAGADLATALRDEAAVAAEIRDLTTGRDMAGGLAGLATRWTGGDGVSVPPVTPPAGIDVVRRALAAGQLLAEVDLEDELGRVPGTVVYVDLGPAAWPEAPAGHRIDLTAPGLEPAMLAAPATAPGEWFVALGERAACRLPAGDDDGTVGQAARLRRVLDALAPLGDDLVVVAVGGAGHAARLAAQEQTAVSDLVLVGTPLGPVSLTAVSTQPTGDALRLLARLLPPAVAGVADDPDLARGRALVGAMMAVADRADPAEDLGPPATALPAPRDGLAVVAMLGAVDAAQVGRAITAVVAAGLAGRARAREAAGPPPPPTGVRWGVRLAVDAAPTGTVVVEGDALVTLGGFDLDGGTVSRELRVRAAVRDRLGWLAATPEQALRMVSADVTVPLDGAPGAGRGALLLHDARALGVDQERMSVDPLTGGGALLPEARLLLGVAVARLAADVADPVAGALASLLERLGLMAGGGAVASAFEQLVHDPAGLVAARLAADPDGIGVALAGLLGPAAAAVDLEARTLTLTGGSPAQGAFGWSGTLTAAPGTVTGRLSAGPDGPAGVAGALRFTVDLAPVQASLHFEHPSGLVDDIALWPEPDVAGIARALVSAAPALGAHVALDRVRGLDEDARTVIDAALDALGALGPGLPGARPLRPLAGLLTDPAGWLRSAESIGGQPARAQTFLDALRALTGLGGAPGDPLTIAAGVALSVRGEGPDLRVGLDVDTAAWAPATAPLGRLVAGLEAAVTIPATGAARTSLAAHVGVPGAGAGRSAVHVEVGATGLTAFVRPSSGVDIPLVPFAGFGALAAAAGLALPFLLDHLAALATPAGAVVAGVGDALGLRSGAPARFDGDALTAWGADAAAALAAAAPSIVAHGLPALAPVVDGVTPATVTVAGSATELTVTAGAVSLAWAPTARIVSLRGMGIDAVGIETLSVSATLAADGLHELTITTGPAAILAGAATLRPFATVAAGNAPAGGRRVVAGLAVDDNRRFAARWLLDGQGFALIASDGPITAPADTDAADAVAARAVEAVAELLAAVALETEAVGDLLDRPVGGAQLRDLVRGVLLEDVASPGALVDGLFDPLTALARLQRLLENLAAAGLAIDADGLEVALVTESGVIGISLGLTDRMELLSGDITLWLEDDDAWIEPDPAGAGGLFLGLLRTGASPGFEPGLTVNGVGLRIGRATGPLLDVGLTLESVALHAFAAFDGAGARAGGVQIAFADLAVAASGATGGNSIAAGILQDSGTQPPKPGFSPALAIQQHADQPVQVTLRAGDGDGPWWIGIRKGFGPLYIEQVGMGVTMPEGRLERISLLFDGSVSLFGLTCAVDDLEITYAVTRGDVFTAASWEVDLAGLAVSADLAGLQVSGGLLKLGAPPAVEYVGMLLARFGVYGISIYGGYGEGVDGGEPFVAFFAVGAVNGPIGGPPAFFLTGIGGGFGINRALVVPSDLSQLGEYPLIRALDISAAPADPMEQLRSLGDAFPMQSGTFWFAAGLSFTSFALVDGIAVVAVEIGDGLDVSLLGLASMALPRPQVALVSIELALLARFSTAEGVLWVQGQLTDNSWLLYPDVELTGGFAFVIWFAGEHRGEFVLTLGGYHPDFSRSGYPVVPRLGLRWAIGSAIVVTAGTYFALTSEAVMAGGDFEASAKFGPAWAEVRFGAHGIVYFDPFRYEVDAHASIAAGVTVDTWIFGEVTFSIHVGSRLELRGPDFHGTVTFEVGPVELTVELGSAEQTRKELLGPGPFIDKYLEAGEDEAARAITVIVSGGALPSGGEVPTPDGSSDRPFVVAPEFSLVLTTLVPASDLQVTSPSGVAVEHHSPSRRLGVAPMGTAAVDPVVELSWSRLGVAIDFPCTAVARPFGAFPVGVWGPPQDDDDRSTPQGEVIEALNELELTARATEAPGGPAIAYSQVEIGPRLPLPFTRRAVDEARLRAQGAGLAALVPEPASIDAAFSTARRWMAGRSSPTALAALAGERQAPPAFGTLGEGLDARATSVVPDIGAVPAITPVDTAVHPPIAAGVLTAAGIATAVAQPRGTTVRRSQRMWRTSPPTRASLLATQSRSVAADLMLVAPEAARSDVTRTVIAADEAPLTAIARAAPAAVAARGAAGRERLTGLTAALRAGRRVAAAAGTPAAVLAAGEVAVLRLPNAARDVGAAARPRLEVRGDAARVVAVAAGGDVLADVVLGGEGPDSAWAVAAGTDRVAVIALGRDAGRESGLAGWHAAMELPYLGFATALGTRCVVRSLGEPIRRHPERAGAGWVAGAELGRGLSTVTTRFSIPVASVLVVLDDPEALAADVAGRRLILALDGATRGLDGAGGERPPELLMAENRSVLAYDVVPAGDEVPVTVRVATEQGWSLAGVLAAVGTSATQALAGISAHGLDAALRPLVPGRGGGCRLAWRAAEPAGRAAAEPRRQRGR